MLITTILLISMLGAIVLATGSVEEGMPAKPSAAVLKTVQALPFAPSGVTA